MSARIEIISPGLHAALQDQGRVGYRDTGVPVSGAVMASWMKAANALVTNPLDQAVIEFRLTGPRLKVIEGPIKVALAGDGECQIIEGDQMRTLSGWRSFTLLTGQILQVGALKASSVGYLALKGEMQIAPVMESLSTYERSQFGGLDGRALKAGDVISLDQASDGPDLMLPTPLENSLDTVRVVMGPQDDFFQEEAIHRFLSQPYQLTREMDRMGARLAGPSLSHRRDKGTGIISDGIVPGAIQVPASGQPIVLLNDAQTVGGYPKIACVLSPDLEKIAGAVPDTVFKFEAVSVEEACEIARSAARDLEKCLQTITFAPSDGFVNLDALYDNNIIGGVVDMAQPDHFPDHLEES